MAEDSLWRSVATDARARALEKRWQELCALYLPRAPRDSIWRYHRGAHRRQPEFGWKLHVSATILNAPAILERVAPVLINEGAHFKVTRSLVEVIKLNSGLYYNYSQIGKVITVYPATEVQALHLAERLHKLTRRFAAPSVPFDLRFTGASNVYYRFGAFKRLHVAQPNGQLTLGIRTPSGELVPDVRENAKPDWVRDPFERLTPRRKKRKAQNQVTPFRVLRALIQRGKGGVYQAIDVRTNPPRLCLLKEGRKHGELTWDGRDGAWRVKNEERVLLCLAACGVIVPKVYSSFEIDGNYYLVMEFVEGESLHNLLLKRKRRLTLRRILSYGLQLSSFLARMHQAGWTWRDCKPKNLIVTQNQKLVPIDFEGSAPIDRPDPVLWGTHGFIPPAWRDQIVRNGIPDDLYALGSILYLLLTGRVFDHSRPLAISRLRRNVPVELRRLVELLLAGDSEKRPVAQLASARLNAILATNSKQRITRQDALAA